MTVSDNVFGVGGGGMPDGRPVAATEDARGEFANARAMPVYTKGDGDRFGWLRRFVSTVRDDVAGSWIWSAAPPNLRDLWRARKPAIGQVPGENRPLHVAWTVYNHAVLAPFAAVAVAMWILQHPARFLLAAAILLPLTLMWVV